MRWGGRFIEGLDFPRARVINPVYYSGVHLKKGRICSSRFPIVPSETIWLIPGPAHVRHFYSPCRNFLLGAVRSPMCDIYVLVPHFWYLPEIKASKTCKYWTGFGFRPQFDCFWP